MSSKDLTVSRAAADDPTATLKAHVEAQFAAALEKKTTLELTQTGVGGVPNQWEVFAWGPWQNPAAYAPGRIIMTNEEAFIAAGVWLNDGMVAAMAGFGAHIELFFFTSNMQTMLPLPLLNKTGCIYPVVGQNFYAFVWKLVPTEAGCLYETNICARVCNCNGTLVPDYAGFVRHVFDFDPENLFPAIPVLTPGPQPVGLPGGGTAVWGFDRPIRYMVADRGSHCECPPTP